MCSICRNLQKSNFLKKMVSIQISQLIVVSVFRIQRLSDIECLFASFTYIEHYKDTSFIMQSGCQCCMINSLMVSAPNSWFICSIRVVLITFDKSLIKQDDYPVEQTCALYCWSVWLKIFTGNVQSNLSVFTRSYFLFLHLF